MTYAGQPKRIALVGIPLLPFDGLFSPMHSKFVPLLASVGLLAVPLQDSSAIPIIYTVDASSSVSANRSEPSLGINTALISSSSGTTFPLDETGQSSIRPARRFSAYRQGSMAVSYGQSLSFGPSRISTNEPMLDAKNFVTQRHSGHARLLGAEPASWINWLGFSEQWFL